MNKANRKFKKMLERDKKSLDTYLYAESARYKEKALELAEKRGISEGSEEEEKFLERKFDEFYNEYHDKFEELSSVREVIDTYEDKNAWFANFELLDVFIRKYNLPDEEQADIIAHFLNRIYKFITREMTEEEFDALKRTVSEKIEEQHSYKTTFFKNVACRSALSSWHKDRENDRFLLQHFRELINESGEILPLWDAFELKNSLNRLNIDLSAEQIDLLLNVSLQRYNQKVAAEAKEQADLTRLEDARTAREQSIADSFKAIESKEKIVRKAKSILRNYLIDDMPIRFLENDEIESVLILLKAGNYTDKQIADIKRRILENNKQLLNFQEQNVWGNAKNILDLNSRNFLEHVEIILAEKSLPDVLCMQLQISYDCLKEQLLILYNSSDFDAPYETEIMLLFLGELAEKFDAFIGSKYSLILELNSN